MDQKVIKQCLITKLGQLHKHLDVWYNWKMANQDKTYAETIMPNLINNAVVKYQHLVETTMKEASTPSTPEKVSGKATEVLNKVAHSVY